MNGYVNQYQQNQIATASREQILIMLYDGAIRFSQQAKMAIDDNDMATKGKYIGKTMAIIAEFSTSLDHEIGGHIAQELDALYAYMLRELSNANVSNDKEKIDVVIGLLKDLRATWAEAIEIANAEKSGSNTDKATAPQLANSAI